MRTKNVYNFAYGNGGTKNKIINLRWNIKFLNFDLRSFRLESFSGQTKYFLNLA